MGPLNVLLDTHVFVWVLTDSPDLRTSTRALIAGAENRFVSAVSYWEIATKSRLGQWPNVDACILPRRRLVELGFTPLGLDMRSAARAGSYDWTHRDPFDRMLVAQAERKKLPLVSYDAAIAHQNWAHVVR